MTEKRFAVALSFAGEYRERVAKIAEHLASVLGRERVLYDKWYEGEFNRPNLNVYLPNLYRTQTELNAVFISAEYLEKPWCGLEWRFILDLIPAQHERIMLFIFDETKPPPEFGILDGDGRTFIRNQPASEIASMIVNELDRRHNSGQTELPTDEIPISGIQRFLLPEYARTLRLDRMEQLVRCARFFGSLLTVEDDPRADGPIDLAQLWGEAFQHSGTMSLLVCGDHGVGKSTLLSIYYLAARNRLLAGGLTPLFLNVGAVRSPADTELIRDAIDRIKAEARNCPGSFALLVDGLSGRERVKCRHACNQLLWGLDAVPARPKLIVWATADGFDQDILDLTAELYRPPANCNHKLTRLSTLRVCGTDRPGWVEDFVFIVGLLRGVELSDTEIQKDAELLCERLANLIGGDQPVDQYLLSIIYEKMTDELYERVTDPAKFLELYCAQALNHNVRPNNARAIIEPAAEAAYRRTVDAFDRLSTNKPGVAETAQQSWPLLRESDQIGDYLTAWHLVQKLRNAGAGSEPLDEIWPALAYDFPQPVNKFLSANANASKTATASVLNGIKALIGELSRLNIYAPPLEDIKRVQAQNLMCYLLGRLNGQPEATRQLLDTAEGLDRKRGTYALREAITSVTMSQDQRIALKTMYRTISISRRELGDEERARIFLLCLLRDRELAEIDRGYHRLYYGDALPYEQAAPRSYVDDKRDKWDKTFHFLKRTLDQEILVRIGADGDFDLTLKVQHHLFTFASFVQSRTADSAASGTGRAGDGAGKAEAFLLKLLDVALASNVGMLPQLRQYLVMLRYDLQEQRTSRWRFVLDLYRLKWEPRRGWLLRGIESQFNQFRVESVADHSLMCMMLALFLLPENSEDYDFGEIMRMLMIHDLAEAFTGDIVYHRLTEVQQAQAKTLERDAMEYLRFKDSYGGIRRTGEAFAHFMKFGPKDERDRGSSSAHGDAIYEGDRPSVSREQPVLGNKDPRNGSIARGIDKLENLIQLFLYRARVPSAITPDDFSRVMNDLLKIDDVLVRSLAGDFVSWAEHNPGLIKDWLKVFRKDEFLPG